MTWLKQYRSSLKNTEAEEPLDIYFYRPLAFIIVKSLYSFPITPNQYSLAALISGFISSYYLSLGTSAGFKIGALFFLFFAVFDCCDGMQARMKKNGSEFGRIIDGLVDYTVNIFAYICLAFGMSKFFLETDLIKYWQLITLAGLSKAVHSVVYDYYLSEYLSYASGDHGFAENELILIKNRIIKAESENYSVWKIAALKIYLRFTQLQTSKRKMDYDQSEYCSKNIRSLKLWSLIGPAVHITVLIFSLLVEKMEILFWYAIVVGNFWLVLMSFYQRQINRKLQNHR